MQKVKREKESEKTFESKKLLGVEGKCEIATSIVIDIIPTFCMNNESITKKTAQTTTTSSRKVNINSSNNNNNNIRNLKERNFASDFLSFTVAASADRTKVICFAGG